MIPVLDAARMRAADARTIHELGLPGVALMECAGAAVARAVRELFPQARPLVLCGRGNNGGDGFVAARRLLGRGARVLLLGPREGLRGDARAHLECLERAGGRVEEIADEDGWRRVRAEVLHCELLVDALLGTGLRAAAQGLVGAVLADLAENLAPPPVGPPVLAVDLPSGVSSDSGWLEGPALRAQVSVTFAGPKRGHVLPPACDSVGRLIVADIGIPGAYLEELADVGLIEAGDAAALFSSRPPGAHKGTFGHVLVLGGAPGKSGAAALAAVGALRAGAGLASVAVPAPALPLLVAAARPEVMTVALPPAPGGGFGPEAVEVALALAAERDAVVLGPGLGQDPAARLFAQAVAVRCPRPLVLDADGLNAFAGEGSPGLEALAGRTAPAVLTPHPGEAARLLGASTGEVQRQRLEVARRLAGLSQATLLLKGQRTLVAPPSGRLGVNPTGNPGMATAGTGDVLAGIVAALLARGAPAFRAACAAAFVHGLAGDLAAGRAGAEALLAGDLVDALPEALAALDVRPPTVLERWA